MTKILLVAAPIALFGAGYAGGSIVAGADALPETESAEHGPEKGHGTDAAKAPHSSAEASHPAPISLGRVILPIEKPRSITYMVADISVEAQGTGPDEADATIDVTVRMRAAMLKALHKAAELPLLATETVDAEALKELLRERLQDSFPNVDSVLLTTLYFQDVPRI